DRELRLREERLQLGELRVQAVGGRAARRLDGEELGLREVHVGGDRTHRGVLRVARAIHGNDEVVAVHAAVEEHADERLVVARRLRLRGARYECRERRQAAGEAARAERGGVAQEIATALHRCTWYWGEQATSQRAARARATGSVAEAAFTAVMMALRIAVDMRPAMRSRSSRSARTAASIAIAV